LPFQDLEGLLLIHRPPPHPLPFQPLSASYHKKDLPEKGGLIFLPVGPSQSGVSRPPAPSPNRPREAHGTQSTPRTHPPETTVSHPEAPRPAEFPSSPSQSPSSKRCFRSSGMWATARTPVRHAR